MTKEELLEEAKRRYPVGTKIKCSILDIIVEITSHSTKLVSNANIIYFETKGNGTKVYENGKWAEIVSKPEEKYEHEVVHCETQEQWDFVIDKISPTALSKSLFKELSQKESIGIEFNEKTYCSLDWFKSNYSKIYSFQEWCTKFNHQFEEFKVGDWVWTNTPNVQKDLLGGDEGFIGKILKIDEFIFKYKISVDSKLYPKYTGSANYDENYVWCKDIRKALPQEIPQSETKLYKQGGELQFKTIVACQGVNVDTRYSEIEITLQNVISVTKQEYKVEDGYLPYPEPIISLQSILSQLND